MHEVKKKKSPETVNNYCQFNYRAVKLSILVNTHIFKKKKKKKNNLKEKNNTTLKRIKQHFCEAILVFQLTRLV